MEAVTEFAAQSEAIVFVSFLRTSRTRGSAARWSIRLIRHCWRACSQCARRSGGVCRYRAIRPEEDHAVAPVSCRSTMGRHRTTTSATFSQPSMPRNSSAVSSPGLPTDRRIGGCDRLRRQDVARFRPQETRQSRDPYGVCLRGTPAPRARPRQSGRQVQRDRRHPGDV